MIIVGAGMSGLLAAHYFRHLSPIVLEQSKSLPHNHKALLRFRSEVVSDLTGIPFKKVNVQKMIQFEGAWFNKANLIMNNLYSQKVTGSVRSRSLSNLSDCERFIAPEDFISKLSIGIDVKYGQSVDSFDNASGEPIISTMPVHTLAKILGYKDLPELKSMSIWTFSFDLDGDVDVYQTVYYPCMNQPVYRISITGKKVIAEFCSDISGEPGDKLFDYICSALENHFGITYKGDADLSVNYQPYGKLIECGTSKVKDFLGWATRNHNIYSLGRWGTHRQILMDDVVKDIKKIDMLIRNNGYVL